MEDYYKRPNWIQGPDGWLHQSPSKGVLERLSDLGRKDFQRIERKSFSAEVKEYDDENLVVEHFISTERPDRSGDIMRADGMKISGKVTVLMAHGFSDLGQEPIARPLKIWADTFKGTKGICARTMFYDGSRLIPPDNTGKRLYEKVKLGFLPNWSIGYIVLNHKNISGPDGQVWRDILEWELLEYSAVGVPMNPDATVFTDSQTALSFKHYAPDDKHTGKILCRLGENKWCRLENLSEVLGKTMADYARKMFRQIALGKID
jgi:hypothetical protein